jgi:ABC-2 type transport system permease protein
MGDNALVARSSGATLARVEGFAGPVAVARVFANETHKNLLNLWAYRRTLIPELALSVFMYIVLQYFIGGGKLVDELIPPTTLAYSTYLFTYYVSLKVVSGLLEEINTGTLEQIHTSPLPSWALSLSRIGAAMIQGAAVTVLVAAGFIVGLDVDFPLRWEALVPGALTVLDVAGFAMLLGGLALTVASIGAILHVIQSLVMFLNGSLVPVEAFPAWLELIARFVPGTLGIQSMRDVLFQGASLTEVWSDGELMWAALHAAAMLLVGWAVYQTNIRRGLKSGRLGP